jgi:tRNA-dihydrouridine synthase B
MVWANFLAPIDEYTNIPFRILCQRHGAEATCMPLINSTAIARGKKPEYSEDEDNLGAQFVGNKPTDIGRSTRILSDMPNISWFNLNCGCPSARTIGSGGGSALLDHPRTISESLREMKRNTDRLVSVKIRLKDTVKQTIELCKNIENIGVDFIIVHGRTAKQGYSGRCNWEAIKLIKESVNIVVVGNGDITSTEQGKELIKKGYCDSFMIGRAAMANPCIFSGMQLVDYGARKSLLHEYLMLYQRYIGTPEATDLKFKAVNFIAGISNASQLRNRVCRAKTVEEIMLILEGND